MSRLRPIPRQELTERQRPVYEAIAGGKRASGIRLFELVGPEGELLGPFNAMLVQPDLGMAVQRVGEVLRYETSLPGQVREAVILTVARHWRSDFEWYAHEAVARAIGLPEPTIAALASARPLDDPPEDIRLAVDLAHKLLRRDRVPTDLYGAAVDTFGEPGLVELVTLVGYYCLLAGLLQVFEVGVPDGIDPPFSES